MKAARSLGLARRLVARVAFGLLALAPTMASAQYPTKPIRMIIPFAAGGTTDLLARAVGQHMTEAWGQPVISDNRAGANGIIAAEIVAKSPPPFDADKDFTPISLIATFPQMVMVNPSVPAQNLGELLSLAKTASPPLTYGSGGNGSSQHLAGALFVHMAGLQMTHVAYKGGAPALLDLMAGNVNMMIVQPTSRDQITSGKLRALAVSSAQRSSSYPDIPTVAEAGVPGYQAVAWYGLVGPKGMSADLLKKISDEVIKASKTEIVRSVIAAQGGDVVASSPAEFADFIAAERKRYEGIVREAGMTVD